MTMTMKCLVATLSIVIVSRPPVTRAQTLSGQDGKNLLASAAARYRTVKSISGKMDVKARWTDEFLALNPSDTFTSVSPRHEMVEFTFSEGKYLFKATSKYKDGTSSDPVTVAFDGEKTYALTEGPTPRMMIRSSRQTQSPGSMAACGAVLLPFSFLETHTDDVIAGPILSLAGIRNLASSPTFDVLKQTGDNLTGKANSLLVATEKDGYTFELQTAFDGATPPNRVRKIDKKGLTVFDYEVKTFTPVRNGEDKIPLPTSATISFYVTGMKVAVYDLDITEVSINTPVDEEEFALDPAEADEIYDLDSKRSIDVPK